MFKLFILYSFNVGDKGAIHNEERPENDCARVHNNVSSGEIISTGHWHGNGRET